MRILIRTKFIILSIFFITFCLIFTDCEEEKPEPRDYPRVNTLPVYNITNEGAVFSADIYSLGTEPIKEYGFVWSLNNAPQLGSDKIVSPGTKIVQGIYNAEIKSALREGVEYTVKPYILTEDHVVYGKPVIFISLGSQAPVITGFEPASVEWWDTLNIYGRNFSWVPHYNIVSLNQTKCNVISTTDTTLSIIVDKNLADIKSKISVEVAGNISVYTDEELNLIMPSILNVYPLQASWGDTITLSGNNLNTVYNSFSVTLGGLSCTIIESMKDSLKVIVPYQLITATNELKISINSLTLTVPEPFTLLPPYYSISPLEGTWQDNVTLTGRFNSIVSRNKVYFNNVQATISSVSATKMIVKVPTTLTDTKSAIKYNVTPFNVVSADTFAILPPILKSFTPSSGPSGTVVTIRGKYFNPSSSSVTFGTIAAQVTSRNDSTIICKVPAGINGPVKITIKTYAQSTTSTDDFWVTNPKITNVYPLTGTFNDEITVTGENFIPITGNTTVFFGNIQSTIKSLSADAIVVQVPLTIDSIPCSIKVTAGPNSIISSEKFTLKPPEILSITPSMAVIGQDITISGNNFNPDATRNQVWWGPYSLKVKSSSESEIIATPINAINGSNKISIMTGGYKRDFPSLIEMKSFWSQIPLIPSFNWNSGRDLYSGGVSFSVQGIGYMMDLYNARMTSFNPLTNEFSDLGIKEIFKGVSGLTCVVHADTAYLIGGNLGIFRYDISTNNWISIGASPTTSKYGVAFSCNGKIYYGLTYQTTSYILSNSFWVYDFQSKNWTVLGKFPGLSMTYSYHSIAFTTIDNKGYVLFANKKLWKYDPETDVWVQLTSLPASEYTRFGSVSFVIDGKIYVGMGSYGGQYFGDFWIYDIETNDWIETSYLMPGGGRINSLSFEIYNKAYIGFGYKDYFQQKDFYEFDPNYPLK